MKVFASCMECQKESGHPSFEPIFAPYYDDRVAYIECSRGHRSAVLLQCQKFEALLDSGANALASKFTLEAAASFSAALERFYEFGLRVFLAHSGVEQAVTDRAFSQMARQSERQIGGFMALHAQILKAPFIPNREIPEFRNSVIHKGLIPTPEEATKFCADVYEEIRKILQSLREQCPEAIHKVVQHDMLARHKLIEAGAPIVTFAGGHLLGISVQANHPTFEAAFDAYVRMHRGIEEAVPHMRKLHNMLSSMSGRADR